MYRRQNVHREKRSWNFPPREGRVGRGKEETKMGFAGRAVPRGLVTPVVMRRISGEKERGSGNLAAFLPVQMP